MWYENCVHGVLVSAFSFYICTHGRSWMAWPSGKEKETCVKGDRESQNQQIGFNPTSKIIWPTFCLFQSSFGMKSERSAAFMVCSPGIPFCLGK